MGGTGRSMNINRRRQFGFGIFGSGFPTGWFIWLLACRSKSTGRVGLEQPITNTTGRAPIIIIDQHIED
ncbi:hypothetical protein CICLE_v10033981mg [Citrus x clementina]|uniref:Uncharacterized protein n=1 Tax=Citrus clementina TaxID=85681 RepID=V4T9P5_CITCL|nr:hypothetical protein CICLE_v10033981mg [Citrus x clementina]